MGTYSIFKLCMCQHGDANSSSNWRCWKSFLMIPPESVEDLKKKYILHNLHLHDSEGMFYGFWSPLRKRSRRICSVEGRSHDRHSPRFACILALFTLAHIACLLHICDKIKKFALLYLGPRPNN